VFVGYQAEGTLGYKVQRGLRELRVQTFKGVSTHTLALNVETVDGFSGHSDRRQLLTYIYHMTPKPDKIVVCHGDGKKCTDLAYTIKKRYGIDARAPLNLETVRLR
jgi:hypothetical protein